MSDLARKSAVPLFERLCAREGESGDTSSFDATGLQLSIANELGRLLNTRCSLTVSEFLTGHATVLNYGMPDFSAMSSRSFTDLSLLSNVVEHAIALFEPRLSHTQVQAVPSGRAPGFANMHITAAVWLGLTLRRVDFDVPVDLSNGTSGAP